MGEGVISDFLLQMQQMAVGTAGTADTTKIVENTKIGYPIRYDL